MEMFMVKNVCKRCTYCWVPRKEIIRMCPRCKSTYWDRDRKRPKKTGVK